MQGEPLGRGVGGLLLYGEAEERNGCGFGDQREHTQTARKPHLHAVHRGTRGATAAPALALSGAAESAAALLRDERYTRGAVHLEGQRAHPILSLGGGLHEIISVNVDGDGGGEFFAGCEVAGGGGGGRLRGQEFGGRVGLN